jgi:hypothetical protein
MPLYHHDLNWIPSLLPINKSCSQLKISFWRSEIETTANAKRESLMRLLLLQMYWASGVKDFEPQVLVEALRLSVIH